MSHEIPDILPESIGAAVVVDDVTTWPGYKLMDSYAGATRDLENGLRDGVNATGQFAGRWALRLGLPLAGAAAMLQTFPYENSVKGVEYSAEGSLFERPGLGVDTQLLGSWDFPHVDGLPIGVHISPKNVDILATAQAASGDTKMFVEELQTEFEGQIPGMAVWIGGEALLGAAGGLSLAAFINTNRRRGRGEPSGFRELMPLRFRQLGAAMSVVAVASGYGVATWNPDWAQDSHLTGSLAAAQKFPGQLADFYNQQSKATDVIGAISEIQSTIAAQIDKEAAPDTAFNIMHISDMHLSAVYPLVEQYAEAMGVKLIINTGDEGEFGTAFEMTPEYLASLRHLTEKIPMIYFPGNHDSLETVRIMSGIPGVIVLGTKERQGDKYLVTAQQLDAFGLDIAGLPDPRIYGADGVYGSDDPDKTVPLQIDSVREALDGISEESSIDIFATHEPAAAEEIAKILAGRVRQTNSGHAHQQNETDSIQSDELISLVEGSTGAGGLDHLGGDGESTPIQFSIESVAPDCQLTKIIRFTIAYHPGLAAGEVPGVASRSTETIYFENQVVEADRVCDTSLGISEVRAVVTPVVSEAAAN